MPVLNVNDDVERVSGAEPEPLPAVKSVSRRPRVFPVCANPRCTSSWLQLWRNRRVPVVEGGWLCSPACTRARTEDLLRREYAEARPATPHRHRVPIGLVLLRQGWIRQEHLKDALEAQRRGSRLRVGEWLVANRGLSEMQLTQALGLQWGCPIFSLEQHASALPVTLIPRLITESFGFVPLRISPLGRVYMAFEDRIDHSLALAVERMTGFDAVQGLLPTSEFAVAQRKHAESRFSRARLIEAGSADLLAEAFALHIEKEKPTEARLVRVHDLLWLRLWRYAERSDASGTLGTAQGNGIGDVIGSITSFS
ncbi:MAG TPA: hypothetical protein VME86_06405 [Acidobacteriaceae bacterium]|nr:hypothetical protein [Acidobacteriaceae bacterium]